MPGCNLSGLVIVKGLVTAHGWQYMECSHTFHDGEGLLGCSNDKSKVIIGWDIIVGDRVM